MVGTYITTCMLLTTWIMPWLVMGSIMVTVLDDGHLMIGRGEHVMVEPQVWQETGDSIRVAAQVEDGKVVRIGVTVRSFIPQTLAQRALLPVLAGSSPVSLPVVVVWSTGTLRWRWAVRDG